MSMDKSSSGGQNAGRSHYVDENKEAKKWIPGRSHYLDEKKIT